MIWAAAAFLFLAATTPTVPPGYLDPRDVQWLEIRSPSSACGDYYPCPSDTRQVGGRVELDCAVTATGRLVDCRVQSEQPADSGLGVLALKIAGKSLLKPVTKSGKPVGGRRLRWPIVFKAED